MLSRLSFTTGDSLNKSGSVGRTIAALLTLVVFFAFADAAQAAVVYDTKSSNAADPSSQLEWSHTVTTSGSNRIIVVGICVDDIPDVSVNSVNYGGQALTAVPNSEIESPGADDEARTVMYYKVNPLTGANTVQVNLSASAPISAGATSYTGVDQSSPLGTALTDSGHDSTGGSVNLSSATGEIAVDSFCAYSSSVTIAAVSPQVERWNLKGGRAAGGGSTKDGAGSVTMTWTVDATKSWAFAAVPIQALTNSAPTAPTTPYSNDTTAQGGQTNPTGLTDATPAFSAVNADPDSGDIADKYRVEVNTQSDFAGTVMWDSGASGTTMSDGGKTFFRAAL